MKVYLAGALFNEGEREYAKKTLDRIESKGIDVYWPWRDAGDQELKKSLRGDIEKVNDEIVKRNLEAIKSSNLMVAIVEGADVDAGTSMEIGYAHALGKRVLGLRTDFRTQGEGIGQTNIMITRSVEVLFDSDEALLEHLKGLRRRAVTKKGLGSFYSEVSKEYESVPNHPLTNYLRLAEQSFTRGLLSGRSFDTALDLGSGPGGFLENISAKKKIGIDLSEGMIEEQRRKLPDVSLIAADIEKGIPLSAGSIDVVHSSFLIDHIRNLPRFFAEANRILKNKEDSFLLSFHNKELMEGYRKTTGSFSFKTAAGEEYDIHSRIPSYGTLKSAFSKHFRLESKETISARFGEDLVGIDYIVLGARK